MKEVEGEGMGRQGGRTDRLRGEGREGAVGGED